MWPNIIKSTKSKKKTLALHYSIDCCENVMSAVLLLKSSTKKSVFRSYTLILLYNKLTGLIHQAFQIDNSTQLFNHTNQLIVKSKTI